MNHQEKMNQAQYIWNRLDDLSASDPEAYKKFIEKQMEERDIYMSKPEARLCILTNFMVNIQLFSRYNTLMGKRKPQFGTSLEKLILISQYVFL